MTDARRLDGQVAIVTGAAQGIGAGIARVLAGAGAEVVIGDLQDAVDTLAAIRQAGGGATGMVMDTSSSAACEGLVDFALAAHGRLDILVNNAAIDAPDGNAWDLSDTDWERTIAVNLTGVFFCARAALRPMLEAGRGVIINMSSQSARHGAKGLSPAYNASKAGVLGLTAALAEQVTERGVRVNAVLPALVESRDFGWTPEQRDARTRLYPLGLGTPNDIGEAVLYLVSPAARWVSGTSLHLTGGAQRGSSVL